MDGGEDLRAVAHLLELGYEDSRDARARRLAKRFAREHALHTAEMLLTRRQLPEAIAALDRLAGEASDWPAPRRLLAQANYAAGRLDAAVEHLDWLTFHGIESAPLALLRAAVGLARRQLDVALDQATYARNLDPRIAGADAIIGQVNYRRRRLDVAQDAFGRELSHHARSADALAGLSAIALLRGDVTRSADLALQALAQNPSMPPVHYRLGVALAKLGRLAEAVVALETAAKLRPGFAAPFRTLSRLSSDPGRAAEYRQQGRERLRARRSAAATTTTTAKSSDASAPSSAS